MTYLGASFWYSAPDLHYVGIDHPISLRIRQLVVVRKISRVWYKSSLEHLVMEYGTDAFDTETYGLTPWSQERAGGRM